MSVPTEGESVLKLKQPEGAKKSYGFSIVGGVMVGGPDGVRAPIVISKVQTGSSAEEGGLKVGMLLLEVNGQSVRGADHDEAVNCLKSSSKSSGLELKVTNPTVTLANDAAASASTYLPNRNSQSQLILPVMYERVEMLYPFKGARDDELEVKKGDIVHVTGKGTDGWVMGTCQRTGLRGMVPGNFCLKLRHITLDSIYDQIENYASLPQPPTGDAVYEELPDPESEPLSPTSPVSPGVQEELNRKPSEIIGKIENHQPLPPPIVLRHDDSESVVRMRPREGSTVAQVEGLYAELNKRSTTPQPIVEDIYATVSKAAPETAPAIPDRKYNKDLLPPTVGVTLETDPNYEILPFMQSMKSHNDQGESDGEEDYETLPSARGATEPALPPPPPARKASVPSVDPSPQASPRKRSKEEEKAEKKLAKQRSKALKAEQKRLAKEAKQRAKEEKKQAKEDKKVSRQSSKL